MKLTYRGISYDYNPPQVVMSTSKTAGKYRGLDVRFRNPAKVPVQQPTLDLQYRGAAYTTNTRPEALPTKAVTTAASTATTAVSAPAEAVATTFLSVQERARQLMVSHHRSIKRRQQTMLARLDESVGLTADDAAHFWNHIQGKVHPSFWATYDRSHAAMS